MTSTTANDKSDNGHGTETPVTDKARQLAEQALESASEKAGGFERKVRDESTVLSADLEQRRREASEKMDATLSEVESYIRKRPVQAAGMAFAAGVLAALVLRR
jgi:ElaB/YqjD/DUF883 family membrane-anchored ribosome-binding protein